MRTLPRALGTFRDLIEKRVAALRDFSFDELQDLASTPTETLSVEGRSAEVFTIVEPMPCGRLRVVLQGSMKTRFLPEFSLYHIV